MNERVNGRIQRALPFGTVLFLAAKTLEETSHDQFFTGRLEAGLALADALHQQLESTTFAAHQIEPQTPILAAVMVPLKDHFHSSIVGGSAFHGLNGKRPLEGKGQNVLLDSHQNGIEVALVELGGTAHS